MRTQGNEIKTIDDYIAACPAEVQPILERIRAVIHEAAPEATEAIKYGLATFVQNGNLVHFGAFKRHIGFYPTASGIAAFKEELSVYAHATGSVQFPLDRPIPYDLIAQITRYRAQGKG